ncbi:MAG: PAS domain S-box protein [Prochloraceae cyanobacterium]|nr:PAS domain S-box protein [Prochloraceae cyanobacterium]
MYPQKQSVLGFLSLDKAIDRHPLIVAPETPLVEVINLMGQSLRDSCRLEEKNAISGAIVSNGCALVAVDSQLVGIFTERDLVGLVAAGNSLKGIKVAEVMTKQVITLKVNPTQDLFVALNLLRQHNIRHLPIVEEKERVIGLVTSQRIRQVLHPTDLLRLRQVSEVMNCQVIEAPPTASVLEVTRLMHQNQIGYVVIVEKTQDNCQHLIPVGIITERDIVQFQRLEHNIEAIQAQTVMSTPLFLVSPKDSLWKIHQMMEKYRVRRLVVAGSQGELRGIVTQTSLLQILDPIEMYGVLEVLQQKVDRLEIQKVKLEQLNTQKERLYRQVREQLKERTAVEKLLREEKNFISAILDVAGSLVFVLDSQGRIVLFNQACEQTTGYTVAEVEGKCIWELFLIPEQLESNRVVFEQLLAGNSPNQQDNYWIAKNGARRLINWSNTVLVDDKGAVRYVVATGIDITERKQAEAALRESQERYALAVNGSQDGLWDWNILTGEVYIAPRFKEILGYRDSEILDLFSFWPSQLHPEDRDRVLAALQNHLENRVPYDIEYRLRHKNGEYCWIHARGQAIWDETGKATRMAGSICDISQRKEQEKKIREQAALLDVATDAIIVRDQEQKILFWNKGAERLYGWKKKEALGKIANELVYLDSIPEFETIETALSEKGEWQGELHQVTKTGKNIIVVSRWNLVANNGGSILEVNTDITEKKQLERQFLRIQRLESIGTLASGIAHDLNNILTPMLAIAQLLPLKLPEIDRDIQQLLEVMQDSARRGADLVKQVLLFARGVEGKKTVMPIDRVIWEVKKFIEKTLPKSIEIQTNVPQDLWEISGDSTQIDQVLMNLCVNARDAMPDGGILSISAENLLVDEHYAQMNLEARVGFYVVITISDTGEGIPPEIIDRIFDPFFTTKQPETGTGLGLSTVIGIVKNHGGFVKVYSEVGSGTRFTVYLPAVDAAAAFAREEFELPAGSQELILVVDDEAPIREITKTTLETYNYRVMTASDGVEAIALFAEHKNEIAVVIMDMMMAKMDGTTAISILQKINPQIKVIAVSGLPSSNKVVIAKDIGIEAFLNKPYTAEDLLTTLDRVFHH